MDNSVEQRIEHRIRCVLSRFDRPMKTRDVQMRVANRAYTSADFRPVLERLIRQGIVWNENGWLELIDKTPVEPRNKVSPLPNSVDLGFDRPSTA